MTCYSEHAEHPEILSIYCYRRIPEDKAVIKDRTDRANSPEKLLHCVISRKGTRMSRKITLRKYPNRRLYDTENSTYVNLRDVETLIKQGRQVEVVDVKTNEDVTAFILTQIIMEQVKKNNEMLPSSLLHLIIRFGEDVLSDFFSSHLEKTVQSYLNYKKTMDEQFKIYIELGMDFSSIAKKTMKEMSPFQSFFEHSQDETDRKSKKDESNSKN